MTDAALARGRDRRLADVLDDLIDSRVGIVRFVHELGRQAGAPNFFHFYAEACDTSAFSPHRNFAFTGGASTNRFAALAKAVGEAVERYCAALFDPDDLPVWPYDAAPAECVPPERFALFSDDQYAEPGFPFARFGRGTAVRWVPLRDALTGEERHVPAAMVFVPYLYRRSAGEVPIAQPISTGLACHCTFEEAAVNAICEVVERDAFMLTWLARLHRPRLRLGSLDEANAERVERFAASGYGVTLFDLTLDLGIPTTLATLTHEAADAPPFVVAAAAHPSPHEAARKALDEVEHTREYTQRILVSRPRLGYAPRHENVHRQIDHLNFWCDRRNRPLADFMLAPEPAVEVATPEQVPSRSVAALARRIADAGYRVLLGDLTSPDVADLGLRVVRAVIPGLHPLTVGYRVRALGGDRLRQVAARYDRDPGAPLDNPAPHPYP